MARTIQVTEWSENDTDTGEGSVVSLSLTGVDVLEPSVSRFVCFHREPNPVKPRKGPGSEPEFSGPVWLEVDEPEPRDPSRGWESGVRWIELIGNRLVLVCDQRAASRWGDSAFELRLDLDTKMLRALVRRLQEYFQDWPGFRATPA